MPNAIPEELKKWVDTLTLGEKRSIKALLKMRARDDDGQQAQLFEWLETTADLSALPGTGFARNLSTISYRLKDTILDGLRLLSKADGIDPQLRKAIDEIALLIDKKLYDPAQRKLRKAKKQAIQACRHNLFLLLLEAERRLLFARLPADLSARLEALGVEEEQAQRLHARQLRLRQRHDLFWVRFQRISIPRNAQDMQEMQALADYPTVEQLAIEGGYVAQALATNILGMREIIERRPDEAMRRYAALLATWRDQPQWQADQGLQLFRICNYFQIACMTSQIGFEALEEKLKLIPDFQFLEPDLRRNFQLMLKRNAMTIALNIGKFDLVNRHIAELEVWLKQEGPHLPEKSILPVIRNFAAAEFLMGHFAAANRHIIHLINMPNRNVREDLREFARVLQVVLQYELGDANLSEYLARSSKRFFMKKSHEMEFELAVVKCLESILTAAGPTAQRPIWEKLQSQLEAFAAQLSSTLPLFGLMEMRLWVKSKITRKPIQDVFLEAVHENLASLG